MENLKKSIAIYLKQKNKIYRKQKRHLRMKNIEKGLTGKALTVLLIILFVPSVGFSEARKMYYESGALQAETTFKNGEQNGPGKSYYESGALKEEGIYKKGKLKGLFKMYYESGALQGEVLFKKGKLEGLYKEYYESGKLKITRTFEKGKLINRKEYNEQGKLIKEK
jgi:antitoxin component YwqK of YwqJK toxin-antitoxin module